MKNSQARNNAQTRINAQMPDNTVWPDNAILPDNGKHGNRFRDTLLRIIEHAFPDAHLLTQKTANRQ